MKVPYIPYLYFNGWTLFWNIPKWVATTEEFNEMIDLEKKYSIGEAHKLWSCRDKSLKELKLRFSHDNQHILNAILQLLPMTLLYAFTLGLTGGN